MLMTLIRSRLQGREMKPFICAQVQDNLYVHFMNHTYLRNDRKINFRMVFAQHFINEAQVVN